MDKEQRNCIILKEYNQEHIIKFLENLNEKKKKKNWKIKF